LPPPIEKVLATGNGQGNKGDNRNTRVPRPLDPDLRMEKPTNPGILCMTPPLIKSSHGAPNE
jgi:hypothetical protein